MENVIVFSACDSKPVSFSSAIATELKWLAKERKVYAYGVEDCMSMHFLRAIMQEMCNHGMNKIDLDDQYRS